jgi:hypothetical protein
VSFQPRGPHTSISISFALTVAEITADSFAVTVGLFGISAPSSIMIPLMNKRPTSNFVKVGSLTQRIACRLIARRQAEIQMERPAIPALRDAHGPAGAVIRETGEARSSRPVFGALAARPDWRQLRPPLLKVLVRPINRLTPRRSTSRSWACRPR